MTPSDSLAPFTSPILITTLLYDANSISSSTSQRLLWPRPSPIHLGISPGHYLLCSWKFRSTTVTFTAPPNLRTSMVLISNLPLDFGSLLKIFHVLFTSPLILSSTHLVTSLTLLTPNSSNKLVCLSLLSSLLRNTPKTYSLSWVLEWNCIACLRRSDWMALDGFRQPGRDVLRPRRTLDGIGPKAVMILPIQWIHPKWSISVTLRALLTLKYLTFPKLLFYTLHFLLTRRNILILTLLFCQVTMTLAVASITTLVPKFVTYCLV